MLKERMLCSIQDLFVNIRFNASTKNAEALNNNLSQLKEKQDLIEHFAEGFQKVILLYCISNLSDFIKENNFKLTDDFSDAVHNLPEIFYKEYNLKQYWKTYIKPFTKQYGKHFFLQFKPIFKGMNTSMIMALD